MTHSSAPLLSVGLPVRNGMPYLEETLTSILNGEFQDYDLIVCDNASTDGTAALVEEFAARDSRIRFTRNETNIGAARNYNLTFHMARGRYFRWMASDDLHSPGAIARCVEALERDTGAVLAFPQTRVIDGSGVITEEHDDGDGWSAESPLDRFICSLDHFGLSTLMFGVIRTDVLQSSTLQGDYPGSDLVMQSDLAIRGRFIQVRGEYLYRRVHPGCTQGLDLVQLAQFYDPGRTTAFRTRELRILAELARIIARARVSSWVKLQMGMALAHRTFWNRDAIASELGFLLTRRARTPKRTTAPARAAGPPEGESATDDARSCRPA